MVEVAVLLVVEVVPWTHEMAFRGGAGGLPRRDLLFHQICQAGVRRGARTCSNGRGVRVPKALSVQSLIDIQHYPIYFQVKLLDSQLCLLFLIKLFYKYF